MHLSGIWCFSQMHLMPLAQHPVRRAFQTKRVRSISCDHEQVIVYANQSFVPPPFPPISMLPVLKGVVLTSRYSFKTGWPTATLKLVGGRGECVAEHPVMECVSGVWSKRACRLGMCSMKLSHSSTQLAIGRVLGFNCSTVYLFYSSTKVR